MFPYLASGELNGKLRPWHEMYFQGPEPDAFPSILSSVPVEWIYLGETFNMNFHAGITGVAQDPTDGTLMPVVGWFVAHSPPKSKYERLKKVKDEIRALLLGHKDEAAAQVVDKMQPWYARVETLRAEQTRLEEELAKEQ